MQAEDKISWLRYVLHCNNLAEYTQIKAHIKVLHVANPQAM